MIYLVRAEGTNLYKIGYTDGKTEKRVKAMQTGCPHKLLIVEEAMGDVNKERFLHETFSEHQKQGEWFELDDNLIEKVIEKMFSDKGEEISRQKLDEWIEVYERFLKDPESTDKSLRHFIELAIMEIMRDNGDIAIQRLLELKTLIWNGSLLKGMPQLTERIYNKGENK